MIKIPIQVQDPERAPEKLQKKSMNRLLLKTRKPIINEHLSKVAENQLKCEIGFGGGLYSASMSIQTTSSITWIPYKTCINCMPEKSSKKAYQCKKPCIKQTQNGEINNLVSLENLKGGIKILKGFKAIDSLKIYQTEVTKVPIILATQLEHRNRIKTDGVLGLGYSQNNLLYRLKNENKIKKSQMAFYFSDTTNFVSFGDYLKYLSQEDFIDYKISPQNEHWMLNIKNINFKNQPRTERLVEPNAKWIFDVSLHHFVIPKVSYNNIRKLIIEQLGGNANSCTTDDQTQELNCDCGNNLSKMPTLQIQFEGNSKFWEFKSQHYSYLKNNRCFTNFIKSQQSSQNNWLVGRKFLKHFYTVFDQDNQMIKISNANPVAPTTLKLSNSTMGLVIGLGIISVLISTILLLTVLKPLKAPKEREVNAGNNLRDIPFRSQNIGYNNNFIPGSQGLSSNYGVIGHQY